MQDQIAKRTPAEPTSAPVLGDALEVPRRGGRGSHLGIAGINTGVPQELVPVGSEDGLRELPAPAKASLR